ncbi:MAG: hypothetical protein HUU10_15750 [Bacteroidetes bacterium]|nr:hypothetical protein [Bacteroidota bacterium]
MISPSLKINRTEARKLLNKPDAARFILRFPDGYTERRWWYEDIPIEAEAIQVVTFYMGVYMPGRWMKLVRTDAVPGTEGKA